jgi:hypothetical protein
VGWRGGAREVARGACVCVRGCICVYLVWRVADMERDV